LTKPKYEAFYGRYVFQVKLNYLKHFSSVASSLEEILRQNEDKIITNKKFAIINKYSQQINKLALVLSSITYSNWLKCLSRSTRTYYSRLCVILLGNRERSIIHLGWKLNNRKTCLFLGGLGKEAEQLLKGSFSKLKLLETMGLLVF
jgi:hypothetical protein